MSRQSVKLHTVKHVTAVDVTVMRSTRWYDDTMLDNTVYVFVNAGLANFPVAVNKAANVTTLTLVLLTETQFLSVKHQQKFSSILWTGRFKYKRKNKNNNKQRLSDTFIKRKCLWQRRAITFRLKSGLQYVFQAQNVKRRVKCSVLLFWWKFGGKHRLRQLFYSQTRIWEIRSSPFPSVNVLSAPKSQLWREVVDLFLSYSKICLISEASS